MFHRKKKEGEKPKYNNKKVIHKGIKFDSQMEADYYDYLLKKHREQDIQIQPKFILQEGFTDNQGKKILPITYKADFMINDFVYDVKGKETIEFKIKKKMFKKNYLQKELVLITKAPLYLGVEWCTLEELLSARKARKKLEVKK